MMGTGLCAITANISFSDPIFSFSKVYLESPFLEYLIEDANFLFKIFLIPIMYICYQHSTLVSGGKLGSLTSVRRLVWDIVCNA